jgi:uncharacterized protein YkwD
MTDSPASGRHRKKPRRGLVGSAVGVLAVLLATAPVVWVMSNDGDDSVEDRPATLKQIDIGLDSERGSDAITDTDNERTGAAVTAPRPQRKATTATATPSTGRVPTTSENPAAPASPVTIPTVPLATSTVTVRPSTRPTATPTTTNQPSPTETVPTSEPPSPTSDTNTQESEVLRLVNAARRNHGCGPLELEDSLVRAAGGHATDMARRNYFSHDTPEGKSAFERMEEAGWRGSSAGENIAAGYDSAEAVFNGWMNSEGHRKNILNCDYNKTGIGYDPGVIKDDYGPGSWVEDFGRN